MWQGIGGKRSVADNPRSMVDSENTTMNGSLMEAGTRQDLKHGLDELRAQGTMILVIGDADSVALHRISSSLLGDQTKGRVPVFALIDQPESLVSERVVNPEEITETQILRYVDHLTADVKTGTRTQEGAAVSPEEESSTNPESVSSTIQGDLNQLTKQLTERVEALASNRSFEDRNLRVCIDSAIPIFDHHAIPDVREFFADLRSLTQRYTAMTHAMYPVNVSADAANDGLSMFSEMLASFDILIEVRSEGGMHEQRWNLLDHDCRTAWIDLNPTEASP